MIADKEITILLASYNGQEYIATQLDSIINQSYTNWRLIIRDDGSTDKTIDIINEYIGAHKNISLIINNSNIKGACANFSALFDLAKRDDSVKYIMFCDQDDIWKPEKIEKYAVAMQQMENEFTAQPFLVYGDFELMTSDGSYMPGDYKLLPEIHLPNLLSFNYVYGCTIIMNRELMTKIDTIPVNAINHDYWIALVASIYKSKYISEKLLRYRQHTNNASGNVIGNNSLSARLKRNLLSPGKENENLKIRLSMFASFQQKYYNQLSANNNLIITNYLKAFNISRFRVLNVMLRNKIFRKGVLQTSASFFQVLFFYNSIRSKVDF
jgi:rhamnosyltransferase